MTDYVAKQVTFENPVEQDIIISNINDAHQVMS